MAQPYLSTLKVGEEENPTHVISNLCSNFHYNELLMVAFRNKHLLQTEIPPVWLVGYPIYLSASCNDN